MFDRIAQPSADALHGVMAKYRADTRPHRIDLGVGVYRDETGHSPVMRAVKQAEADLVEREDSKAYQALHGDDAFLEAMTGLVFGADHPAVRAGRVAAIPGPTRSTSASESIATRPATRRSSAPSRKPSGSSTRPR